MRRREFIMLVGGAAAGWPRVARAQQSTMPVIGFLKNTAAEASTFQVAAFRRGLREMGYDEDRNVSIEYDRLTKLAVDLVQHSVDLIVAAGDNPALAAKAATPMIPIVFAVAGDPVQLGVVSNLSHPDGNATGVSFFSSTVTSKRLGLLHTFATKASLLGLLVNPTNSSAEAEVAEAETAAHALGCELLVVKATNTSDIDMAFATLMQRGAGGAVIAGDAFFINSRDQIVALAARNRIPTVYNLREYVQVGGLMSYGADIFDIYRQAGRMLRGVKPADLPVMLPTKFPLIINLRTAKALGLTIPDKLMALANEVIE